MAFQPENYSEFGSTFIFATITPTIPRVGDFKRTKNIYLRNISIFKNLFLVALNRSKIEVRASEISHKMKELKLIITFMQIEFHNDAIKIIFTNEQGFDTKIKRLEREIMLPYHIYLFTDNLLNGVFKELRY